LLFCDKPHLLVAHRAALAGPTPIEFLDDHSIPVDIGFCKHRFVGIPVFFRAVALSELWSCRTAFWDRRTKGPDRSRGLHVGIRVFGVSCSRHLPDYSILGERSTRSLVRNYLEARYPFTAKNVGAALLSAIPPPELGHDQWTGVSILIVAKKQFTRRAIRSLA
jgi:hypothetical protein